jgi:hypothetical protein
VVLDSRGEAAIYWNGGAYDVVLKDSAGATIWGPERLDTGGSDSLGFVSVVEYQTATAGQTVFTVVESYAPGTRALRVFVDGLLISDYAETDENTVTLSTGLSAGQEVTFEIGRFTTSGVEAAAISYTASGGTARGLDEKLSEFVSVLDFGANTTPGTTDMAAVIQAALDSGASVVHVPDGNYYCATGLTIPQNVALIGEVCLPTNPPQGTRLTFALAVATCVTLGGTAASNGSGRLQNISITRAAGAIPANSIGVKIDELYAASLEDVCAHRHSIGFSAEGDADVEGIAYMFTRCWSGSITDSHIVIDSVPEVRFSQCRFGMNGAGDQNCNSYVRIQGGSTTNAAGGPNTVVFTNVQFNQGQNAAATWLDFKNKTPAAISDQVMWQFGDCYIEAASAGIRSDASWTSINRLLIGNSVYNGGGASAPFLSLNAATGIDNWSITGSQFYGALTIAPTPQINFLNIANCYFLGNVSVTGPTNGSTALIADTWIAGNLTLAGTFGVFGVMSVRGGGISGTFTNTAVGTDLDFAPYTTPQGLTPTMLIAGVSTGITTSSAVAQMQRNGKVVHVQFDVLLTSKGAGTGTVTLSIPNMPAIPGAGYTIGGTGPCVTTGMSGLSGNVFAAIGAGSTINLYQSSATGSAVLTDANLTNTSRISGCVEFFEDS